MSRPSREQSALTVWRGPSIAGDMATPEFLRAAEAFQRGDLHLALTLAEAGLAAAPGAEWQHFAGLVHCRLGDPARGVAHLKLAAEAEPANLAFRVMLARALIDAGRPTDVLAMAMPDAASTPAELALWHARAEAANRAGNRAAAVEAWTMIAGANPKDAQALINLARGLSQLGQFDEAEQALRRALEAEPRNPAATLYLGLAYERTNQLEQLDGLLERALAEGIGDARLNYLRAVREQRAGNLGAAREHLLKADAAEDPVSWHHLRGRIADKEGDAALAFASAEAMNRATADFDRWRARGAKFRHQLRELADTITPQWAARLPRAPAPAGRMPGFLVGFPRSGTTLLDTFLMGHPAIAIVEEKEILRRASEGLGGAAELPSVPPAKVEQARRAYLEELLDHVDPDFAGLAIDKNPFNLAAAPFIHSLFPGTPIIFAARHPCDAVLSGFMQSFIPNVGMASFLDLTDAAELYDAAMRLWFASTAALPLKVHTIAYEKLVADPAGELRAVVGFLGLDWHEAMLDHRATAKARGAITNTSYDQVTEALTPAAVGRWRRYEQQLEPVLPLLLPWAERLGYCD